MRQLTVISRLSLLSAVAIGVSACGTKPLGNYSKDSTERLSDTESLITVCWPTKSLGQHTPPQLLVNGLPAAELSIEFITEVVVPKSKNTILFRHESWRGAVLRVTIDSATESRANILLGTSIDSSYFIPTPWFFLAGARGTWSAAPTTPETIQDACPNAQRIRIRPT